MNALICDPRGRVLSAGADGFLEIWDINANAASERFQLSPYSITSMALRPGKAQVTLVESDSLGLYRISAWDYEQKKNLFTLRFRDSISYANYSAAGNFLMVARSGRTGVAFINSDTGEVLKSPQELTGTVAFAATGRSERTMISYMPSGVLSYWDLESGEEIRHFNVPSNISSPVLLGNNRFFAGFDSSALVVLDAVSGQLILRESSIPRGTIIAGNNELSEFVCLAVSGNSATLYHLNISNSGNLETKNRRPVPSNLNQVSAGAVISDNSVVLGTRDGQVFVFNGNGSSRVMNTHSQLRLLDASVSGSALAFIAEDSKLGFIPLDYAKLDSKNTLRLQDASPYTHVSSDPAANSGFLLWQSSNTRSFPVIKTLSGQPEYGNTQDAFIDKVTLRFPLRSVAILKDRFAFLDSVGNITVTDQKEGRLVFSHTSSGAQDAAFIDENNMLIGRSVGTGSTAFLIVNVATGETVPLSIPASIGAEIYRSSSGNLYGGILSQNQNGYQTSVLIINTANPAQSRKLIEYSSEDTKFTMAEAQGYLATSLGGDRASLYRTTGNTEARPIERSDGLPQSILEGERWFIVIDTEGNICWHDPRTGRLLASFKLYGDEWVLEKGSSTIRGKVNR
ncbi:WD40 repeat domain-containing protein [Leadbettera azotonutricia]|uniref:WD40 repeat domain-containing protein n=1 Tax=Leadbettera azotonutricia TaxID=150829 RepID=UPI0002D4D7CC|nr:WD40 repeat domain-containing protein [Leadbettera azotonutricia]